MDLDKLVEPVRECSIETDLEILIPDYYISNISERLQMYSKLDSVKDLESLNKLVEGMVDRFGPMPTQVEQLVTIVKMRWEACHLGFEKLTLKKETLKGYIPSQNNDPFFQSETFSRILQYVQQHSRRSRLKEAKDKLIVIVENVSTLESAQAIFEELQA